MKTFKKIAVLAVLGLMCISASALPVTGGISLAGGYTLDTGDINTANAFTSFSTVIVTSKSGSYAPVPIAQAVTQNGFVFDPFPGAGVVPLWTFTIAATTYSFDLLTIQTPIQPGDGTLALKGTGRLKITGFTDTIGSWIFTANSLAGTFSFSSSNGALPDGGTTIALLGLAMVGLGAARRKFNM